MLLGIDIFLAMSLLSALMDDDLPSTVQYLFQGAAVLGLGQLFISQGFITSGIFARDPSDPTRFWISVIYLASAVSNVIGLNIYLAAVRRKMALASTFSGTVTVPTVMTSAFFLSSFVGTGGEVSFTPATIGILGISALVTGLSVFGFLRQASKHISPQQGTRGTQPTPPVSTGSGVQTPPASSPPNVPGIVLPFRLPTGQGEYWEEAPSEGEEGR